MPRKAPKDLCSAASAKMYVPGVACIILLAGELNANGYFGLIKIGIILLKDSALFKRDVNRLLCLGAAGKPLSFQRRIC